MRSQDAAILSLLLNNTTCSRMCSLSIVRDDIQTVIQPVFAVGGKEYWVLKCCWTGGGVKSTLKRHF